MKVLHLPTSVGGNAYGLSRAERALGIASDTLYKTGNWLQYPGDVVLNENGLFPAMFLSSALAAFRVRKQYDVLHFNFGSSLIDWPGAHINHWDLPLYKKQKLVVTYNGCDARQRFRRMEQAEICACRHPGCYNGICKSKKIDAKKQHRIFQFERTGAIFFSLNPDLMNVLPPSTRFLPYTIAGWNDIHLEPILDKPGRFTIVHAPTDRVCKGTETVVSAVKKLKIQYGDRLELLLVEKMSHEEALKAYRKADLVVDQLRIGWYGALAVENMKMGKPVVVYINPDDLHFIPSGMAKECREALILANENTLVDVLGNCIENPSFLREKRQAVVEYVYRWHLPKRVAGMMKQVYEGVF